MLEIRETYDASDFVCERREIIMKRLSSYVRNERESLIGTVRVLQLRENGEATEFVH